MKKTHILCISIFFIFFTMFSNVVYANSTKENNYNVVYKVHVQNIGWQNEVADGLEAGTTGSNLRLEAIKIELQNMPENAKIKYSVYVQDTGWQSEMEDGKTAGSVGKELRIEAIKIRLENLEGYDIKYRVHMQNIGWMRWVKNGEISGMETSGLRIEAVQIKLVKKSEEPNIIYSTHIQNIGWQKDRENGRLSGTTGQSLRLEAINIDLDNVPKTANIFYRTHIQYKGWTKWVQNGQISGSEGQGLRMEAIQINVENLEGYSIEYRVHIENIGWTRWVQNKEIAGTTGKGLRLEAIEIKLKKKEETKHLAYGIDVSKYQENIDWQAVKNDGIDFAMIRVGFRGYEGATLNVDPFFHKNMEGAIKAGLDVGVYFFTQAINTKEAVEEAEFVLNLIKKYKITYPVVIDTEYANEQHTGRADGLSKDVRTSAVKVFCDTIKNKGYTPMIYGNKWWFMDMLDMSKLGNYDVWLAHYTGATQDSPFDNMSDYNGNYTMWQYTDIGRVNGINTFVDCNIAFKKYSK